MYLRKLATAFIGLLFFSLSLQAQTSTRTPNLYALKSASRIIDAAGQYGYQTDDSWVDFMKLMKVSKVLDDYADRIIASICSSDKNKSVLLVGEPSNTFRYIFARVASKPFPAGCDKHAHVELVPSKIQGHQYAGTTEKNWQMYVETGAYEKDAILYLDNLNSLIGVGTHSNQATGIESEYVAAIDGGKLKSVAFIDKYSYEKLNKSEHSYVLNAFSQEIKITNMEAAKVKEMIKDAIGVYGANVKFEQKSLDYLGKVAPYYLPNVMDPQRSLDVLKEIIREAKGQAKTVDYEEVRRATLKVAQVPLWYIERDFSVIKGFKGKLDADVVGVVDGKRDIVNQVKIGYVTGRTDEKPAGAILLAGPTGTGKSYIAKKTAEFLDMKLITMDMTQYGNPYTFDRFVETLSKNLLLYPYAVYLFEEIDKADVRVLDRLYFMMDEGIFYDQDQKPIFARGAFILMTTNQGHQTVVDNKDKPFEELEKLVNKDLQKLFRPSFLNRFDQISIFLPFTQAEYLQLANVLVNKKLFLLKELNDWDVTVSPEVVKFCATNGQSKLFGARPMERVVNNVISAGISHYSLNVKIVKFGNKISIKHVSKNIFSISVNGGKEEEFEVELGANPGTSFFMPDLRDALGPVIF